jgi:hypothetical protein
MRPNTWAITDLTASISAARIRSLSTLIAASVYPTLRPALAVTIDKTVAGHRVADPQVALQP